MAGKRLCTPDVRQTRHSDSAQRILEGFWAVERCVKYAGAQSVSRFWKTHLKRLVEKKHAWKTWHDRHDAVDEALKQKDRRWSEIVKNRGRVTRARHDVQIEAMRHTWCKWECKNTKGLCNLWITNKEAPSVSRLWIEINFLFCLVLRIHPGIPNWWLGLVKSALAWQFCVALTWRCHNRLYRSFSFQRRLRVRQVTLFKYALCLPISWFSEQALKQRHPSIQDATENGSVHSMNATNLRLVSKLWTQ